MPTPNLLSTKQVADELSVDRSLVTRLVQSGKLKPALKGDGIRGAMYFRPAEVARYKRTLDAERVAS